MVYVCVVFGPCALLLLPLNASILCVRTTSHRRILVDCSAAARRSFSSALKDGAVTLLGSSRAWHALRRLFAKLCVFNWFMCSHTPALTLCSLSCQNSVMLFCARKASIHKSCSLLSFTLHRSQSLRRGILSTHMKRGSGSQHHHFQANPASGFCSSAGTCCHQM